MRNKIGLTAFIALAFLTMTIAGATSAFAQASSSTAEVRGQVTDANGAVVANAKLTLTDVVKGTSRQGVSDSEGNYAFLGLLPSSYDMKVEAQGFGATTTRLELTVGQQANIPIKLSTGKVEIQVDVVAGAEVVETNRTEQASTVDAKQISNLPINRRNFLDYALLTPGVVDADNIADSSDFRVAQTPQSGLSFGGNNGRGNMVQVDGAETLGASGGVQATVSQEAVQEFQVVRNSYSAELGGAAGGVVNIVSKSGGNGFHGGAFGLFRDKAFDARNAFDFNPNGQSPFNRQQYGGSFGGPIRQDKTFFFTAVERFSQERTSFVNLLDPNIFQPTGSQAALFNFLKGSAATSPLGDALLTTTMQNAPRTVQLFTNASGQFPFDESQTQFSSRLDHNFSERSSGYLRFNVTDGNFENQAAGALTAVSRGRQVSVFNGGVVGSHNYQFSPTAFNELKLQYSYTRAGFFTNDPFGPEINIEGSGNFGRDIFLPSENIERHYDIYDNFSKIFGDHTLKFGGSMFFNRLTTTSETFFGGRFNFGQALPLSILLSPAAAPDARTLAGQVNGALLATAGAPGKTPACPTGDCIGTRPGPNGTTLPGNLVADVLETTLLSAVQSFNFNLPIVYQQGFGDASANSWTGRYGLYLQDAWKLRPNFTLNYGLRYSIHDEPFFIPTYKRDFQPRVGFSWDPRGDGKTAIRGGAGIYIGFLNNAVANVTTELSGMGDPDNINIVLATATSPAGLPTSFAVYQSLLARNVLGQRSITLADVAVAPLNINPRPGAPLEVRFRLGPNYRNPTTYQTSLGVQRDLGAGLSLELNYLFVRGLHIARNRDINQIGRTGAIPTLNPDAGPAFTRLRDFTVAGRFQDNIYETTANSFYHGFTAQVQKRFARNFSLNAHYTLSKAIDEVTDFNSDFSAQNPLGVGLDRALSSFDQRHRFVASGVIQSPFANPIARDWLLAPIVVAQSGRPFNLLLGFDANGDGRSQSDRPGQAGRNTGKGDAFYSFDLRLARRFFVKESRFLEVTVEGFNLFNRTNFQGINNIIGGACVDTNALPVPCTAGATRLTTFDLRGRDDQKPTRPLGFTSASDPRQLQFGARFSF
ncbi:MAG TPA: TonB-dependent receptor [Blastocatellia bacterium]|nr:TonB-dependent receptor [Blastocatellia bacterium]